MNPPKEEVLGQEPETIDRGNCGRIIPRCIRQRPLSINSVHDVGPDITTKRIHFVRYFIRLVF